MLEFFCGRVIGSIGGFLLCALFVGRNVHHGSVSFPVPPRPKDERPPIP